LLAEEFSLNYKVLVRSKNGKPNSLDGLEQALQNKAED